MSEELSSEQRAILTRMAKSKDPHLTASMIASICDHPDDKAWALHWLAGLVERGLVEDLGSGWFKLADRE